MRSSFHLSDVDFLRSVRAISKGKISDSHLVLLIFLSMFVRPVVSRGDYRLSVSTIAKSLNASPNTSVKRLNFLSEYGIVNMKPVKVRSNSRIVVDQIRFDRLSLIESQKKIKVTDTTRTQSVLETIKQIKSYLPEGPKRNFSAHPKHLQPLERLTNTGVNIKRYVKWLDRTYQYFSLGLMYSSFTLDKFRQYEKTMSILNPQLGSRKENEDEEAKFWRNR